MAERRRCYVHLPNEKKLELHVEPKTYGQEIFDHVVRHFQLKEKEYFGICYKTTRGHCAWLHNNKRIQDQDHIKKSWNKLEFHFAIKFFVDRVICLKHPLTVELLYLHLKSLIYKATLLVRCDIVFKLAAFVLQIKNGDCEDGNTALENLRQLPFLPEYILQEYSVTHCENSILKLYRDLKGWSKGKAIVRFINYVETLPSYGMHHYKIKDKSGKAFWLGIGFKGIFLFDIKDRSNPIKTYHWQQVKNLQTRDKKFSIEVIDRYQRRSSAGAKIPFAVNPLPKSGADLKTYSWYGHADLIKIVWHMSTSQHQFYLDNAQKANNEDYSNIAQLTDSLTNNPCSLIASKKSKFPMTPIKDLDSAKESPQVIALKQSMGDGLKARRTKLEDRLYDKVQELKKLCLEEADIIGKIPPEYIRYMDFDEKPPKMKKRVGAEFKVKLKSKETNDREHSASSGSSRDTSNPVEELLHLEQDFETLSQIANAAKKLAADAKGRAKKKRLKSFQRTFDKLQAVEGKINVVRKKIGQQPSIRASMLISPEDEILFEEGRISFPGGTESEQSSLSDGLQPDDNRSIGSGAEVKRPPPRHKHSASAVIDRSVIPSSPGGVSLTEKRSRTPPPSFERTQHEYTSGTLKKDRNRNHTPLAPSPQSSSGVSMDSASQVTATQDASPRNWTRTKWSVPRSNKVRGWNESSLDSIDTMSSASRLSEDTDGSSRNEMFSSDLSTSVEFDIDPVKLAVLTGYQQQLESEAMLINQLALTNLNQNNAVKRPIKIGSRASDRKTAQSEEVVDGPKFESSPRGVRVQVSRVDESSTPNSELASDLKHRTRHRSSSLSESITKRLNDEDAETTRAKNDTLKANSQPDYLQPSPDTYNLHRAFVAAEARHRSLGQPGPIVKSRSSQNLQPTSPSIDFNVETQQPDVTYRRERENSRNLDQSRPNVAATGHKRNASNSSASRQNSFTPVENSTGNTGKYPHLVSHDHYQEPEAVPEMTNAQRDMLNNEVYHDLGMGWVPSLNEYSSRASVCESASVHSRKEDIVRFMEDHLAHNRNSSHNGSHASDRDHFLRKRKMREQYSAMLNHQSSTTTSPRGKTWADYQKQPVYHGLNAQRNIPADGTRVSPSASRETSRTPRNPYQQPTRPQPAPDRVPVTSRPEATTHPDNLHYPLHPPATNPTNPPGFSAAEVQALKQRLLFEHYLHHNHVTAASTNQQHEPDRRLNVAEQPDHLVYASPATSDGSRYYFKNNHWVAYPDERRHVAIPSQENFEHTSSLLVDNPNGSGRPGENPGNFSESASPLRLKSAFRESDFTTTASAPTTPRSTPLHAPKLHNSASADNVLRNGPSLGGYNHADSAPEYRRQSADDLLSTSHDPFDESSYLAGSPHFSNVSSNHSASTLMRRNAEGHPVHHVSSPYLYYNRSSPVASLHGAERDASKNRLIHNQKELSHSSKTGHFPHSGMAAVDHTHRPSTPQIYISRSNNSPTVTAPSGGTLPRSSKLRRRIEPSGRELPSWNTLAPKRGNTLGKKLNHKRTSSDVPSAATHPSIPLDPSSRFLQSTARDLNPDASQFTFVQDGHPYSGTNSLRRVKKHSASADDLLWRGGGDPQAGTLV